MTDQRLESSQSDSTPRHLTTLLVTGGAGFIGSNFIQRTLELYPEVSIVALDSLTYAANLDNFLTDDGVSLAQAYPGRFSFVEGDITDDAALEHAVELFGIDSQNLQNNDSVGIVHFAAESHVDNALRNPELFAQTNVLGTVKLLELALRYGLYFHHISTDEVFGDLPLEGDQEFTANSPYNPSSSYSASKAASDHFVRAFVRSHGLDATISNCSNNYGPRQHPEKFIPRQITGLILGQTPRLYGAGQNVRDWIHVDDHNDAVWQIMRQGTAGNTYLIGAHGQRSNKEVVQDLLKLWGQDPERYIQVTDRPGHDRRYALDPSSTESLGWVPRHKDFQEGLAQTVQWYEDHPQWWSDSKDAAEKHYADTERIQEEQS